MNYRNINRTIALKEDHSVSNLIHVFIFILSFLFVSISCDNNILDQNDHTLFFRKIFYTGFYHERLFNLFDYSMIAFSIMVLKKYGSNYSSNSGVLKLLFWSFIFNFIFLMVNPNNETKYMFLGYPLISDVSIYSNILFMYVIFFLRDKYIRNEVLLLFVRYILVFMLIKIFILLILWIQGKGNYSLFGLHSVLIEEDTLLFIAFVQMIILSVYILSKKRKYLIIWVIFVVFEIISFRRSGMFLTLLTSLSVVALFQLKNTSLQKKYLFIVIFSVILIITVFSVQFLPYKAGMVVARYVGEYVDLPGVPHDETFKNLHIEQANWGFFEALNILGIWGYGYGKVYGEFAPSLTYGNTGLHNAYISMWMNYSIFNMMYYVLLFLISLFFTIKHLLQPVINKSAYFLKATILIYILLFFVNAWVLPTGNFTESKMTFTRTLLFIFAYGLTDKDLWQIFKKYLN